jgi:hypothetical protein
MTTISKKMGARDTGKSRFVALARRAAIEGWTLDRANVEISKLGSAETARE